MQPLLKSGVLKRSQRKNNKNKIFEWITIRKEIEDVLFEIILNNLKNIL